MQYNEFRVYHVTRGRILKVLNFIIFHSPLHVSGEIEILSSYFYTVLCGEQEGKNKLSQ